MNSNRARRVLQRLRATAYLHMNNLADARESAYQSIQLDIDHDEPGLYLLAAQIYERQGDHANAIAQLHELLPTAHSRGSRYVLIRFAVLYRR